MSHKETFGAHAYSHSSSHGIAPYNNQWYHPNKWKPKIKHIPKMTHFKKIKCQMDILLNFEEDQLKICLVGLIGNEYEAVIGDINSAVGDGFVPQVCFHRDAYGSQVRIAKIHEQWYGIEGKKIFEQ